MPLAARILGDRSGRGPARVAVLVTALLLAAAPAARAAPPWSQPADVPGTEAGEGLLGPFLDFSSRGTGVLFTSRARLGGELLAPVRGGQVEGADDLDVEAQGPVGTPSIISVVPSAASGLFGAVTDRRRRLFAAVGALGRGFTRLESLGPAPRGGIALAANARGHVAITFIDRQGLKLAVRRPGGRFRRPVLIARVRGADYAPAVTINSRGDVLVAWNSEFRAGTRRRAGQDAVFARPLTVRGRLGRMSRLGPVVGRPAISVALGPRGASLVAWQDTGARRLASVAYVPSGSTRFRRRQVLERYAGGSGAAAQTPLEIEVGFPPRGETLVAWGSRAGDAAAVRVARLEGGRFRSRETLSPAGSPARFADLALGPRGEALVLWEAGADSSVLMAATRPPGATAFAGAEPIAAAGAAASVGGIDPVTRVPLAFWIDSADGPATIRCATRSPID